MNKKILLFCLLTLSGVTLSAFSEIRYWKFPPSPPPERYGNLLIERTSADAGVKPVSFSHWMHRVKYTCRVCHSELGFQMKVNTTMITEEANVNGEYCGACHNGEISFGQTEEHCDKCHNADLDNGKDKFDRLSGLPWAAGGNNIDWAEALKEGFIQPETYLKDDSVPIQSRKNLTISAGWTWVYSDAQFSHEVHGRWLGCSNCHPGIFTYEPEKTEGLRMLNILNKKYCGVCHGTVAFPINNCRRCHPTIHY
jgi:c(7)-type cytochrome triheme protein